MLSHQQGQRGIDGDLRGYQEKNKDGDRDRERPGDDSFMSAGSGESGGSGEVKAGESTLGYTGVRQGDVDMSQGDIGQGDISQWRDDWEMEEVDDGGDGWYEKAMEIIRQDAMIQEQVLAATLF